MAGDRVRRPDHPALAAGRLRPTAAAGRDLPARRAGQLDLEELADGGFAQEMGLKVGDLVRGISLLRAASVEPLAIDQVEARIAAMPEGSASIRIDIQRGARDQGELVTTLRNSPALSFFPGSDGEWIIWTPRGYYDTSIAGDGRLLGWHVNRPEVVLNFRPLPSDFYPMSRYQEQLHWPREIDALLANGQGNLPPPDVRRPPRVQILAPAGAIAGVLPPVQQPPLSLQYRVDPGWPSRRIRSVVVYNGTHRQPPRRFDPPITRTDPLTEVIPLQPGPNPITIEAVDDLGVMGRAELLVTLDVPPPELKPRLVIGSIGVETFAGDNQLRIKYAGRDASQIGGFLQGRRKSRASNRSSSLWTPTPGPPLPASASRSTSSRARASRKSWARGTRCSW